jgi:pilus assembly protein Flp/PilA
MNSVVRFLKSEDGPTAVEYAVMLALIVLAISASVGRLATATGDMFDRSGNALSQVGF